MVYISLDAKISLFWGGGCEEEYVRLDTAEAVFLRGFARMSGRR
jgi:hypothetical protein